MLYGLNVSIEIRSSSCMRTATFIIQQTALYECMYNVFMQMSEDKHQVYLNTCLTILTFVYACSTQCMR